MMGLPDLTDELIMRRARLAAYPDHSPWIGANWNECPICHASVGLGHGAL